MKALHVSLLLSLSLQAMTTQEAHHLISRTHFGVDKALLTQYEAMRHEEAVHYVIAKTSNKAISPAPLWTKESLERPAFNSLSDEERQALQRLQREKRVGLKTWWYGEMLKTPTQLTEMMTLFWHNHFVSSSAKVKQSTLMYRQNVLFRSQALGSYKKLLYAIIRDSAMLIYLDNTSNTKKSPNENFARELLELFSLGEGSYSEDDVKNAAKALTGYSVNKDDGSFKFNIRQHDFNEKEFLGQTGRFNGEDIVRIILEDDETAKYITRKMWRYFVSNTPDEEEIEKLSSLFRASNYEIKPLLEAMLNLESFKSPDNYGSLIKSPVELTVGTLKTFKYLPSKLDLLVGLNYRLGQDIFAPPNVKGWLGYSAWINTSTLIDRHSFLEKAVSKMYFPQIVPTQKTILEYQNLLLSTEPLLEIQTSSYSSLVKSILLDSSYQIK